MIKPDPREVTALREWLKDGPIEYDTPVGKRQLRTCGVNGFSMLYLCGTEWIWGHQQEPFEALSIAKEHFLSVIMADDRTMSHVEESPTPSFSYWQMIVYMKNRDNVVICNYENRLQMLIATVRKLELDK